MLENFKIKIQSYVGLIYGRYHFLCEPFKNRKSCALIDFLKHALKSY